MHELCTWLFQVERDVGFGTDDVLQIGVHVRLICENDDFDYNHDIISVDYLETNIHKNSTNLRDDTFPTATICCNLV